MTWTVCEIIVDVLLGTGRIWFTIPSGSIQRWISFSRLVYHFCEYLDRNDIQKANM